MNGNGIRSTLIRLVVVVVCAGFALKALLLASVYFGLTNSGMPPPVCLSFAAYGARAKSSWLIDPGQGE